MKQVRVAILGATGMVGRRFLSLLIHHPWFKITVLAASPASVGKTFFDAVRQKGLDNGELVRLDEAMRDTQDVCEMRLMDAADVAGIAPQVDLVFCALKLPAETIRQLEEAYARAEVIVVSNNSAHRWTPDVPIMIPELNASHTQVIPAQRQRLDTRRGFIVAKPNCSIQSFVPPLHALWDLSPCRVLVSTYQAVSGASRTLAGWHEIHDNVIPFIKGEEEKTETEPLKIWGQVDGIKIVPASTIKISAQCVRVPVSDGHLATVSVLFADRQPSFGDIVSRWVDFSPATQGLDLPSAPQPMLNYLEDEDRPQTRLDRDQGNGMAISVGRLRPDPVWHWKFVCLSHNTIRGAAGGAVLTAEMLVKQGWLD